MLLWELAIQPPDMIENLSAAFLLLDGAAEAVPSFQVNQRVEEEEGGGGEIRDGKKIRATTNRRYCPWKPALAWHGGAEAVFAEEKGPKAC